MYFEPRWKIRDYIHIIDSKIDKKDVSRSVQIHKCTALIKLVKYSFEQKYILQSSERYVTYLFNWLYE